MHTKLLLSCWMLAYVTNMAVADTYADCKEAISANDHEAALKFATRLLRFRNISDPSKQKSGAACLTFAKGTEYTYDFAKDGFAEASVVAAALAASQEEFAAREEERAKRESIIAAEKAQRLERERIRKEAEAAKVRAVWQRVTDACVKLYQDDPDGTVTNRICLDVFLQTGLPAE